MSQLRGLRRLDLAGLAKVDDEVVKALASTLSLSHVDLSRYVQYNAVCLAIAPINHVPAQRADDDIL